jgi:hypothetical protein
MKKKVLGYGYKESFETLEYAMSLYGPQNYHKTKREAEKAIKTDKINGYIKKNSKPKIFRLVVEVV